MEKEKVDKAAMGYDYKGETEKHQSQKGYHRYPLRSLDTSHHLVPISERMWPWELNGKPPATTSGSLF